MVTVRPSNLVGLLVLMLGFTSACVHRTSIVALPTNQLREQAVRQVIEELRRSSYESDTTGDEWTSDSTVLERIFSSDYVRFAPNGSVLRGEDFKRAMRTRQINRTVAHIEYDQLQVAMFEQTAVVFYRSVYRNRDGQVQAYRVTRTLRNKDGTWVIIAGFGMPIPLSPEPTPARPNEEL